MNILILGANGQLGSSLQETAPESIRVLPVDIDEVDIGATQHLCSGLDSYSADAIINAAAYTAVDKAEAEPELAQRINGEAVGILATYCSEKSIPLLHVSTDFVFSGEKQFNYVPEDSTGPLSVYGKSKLAGEEMLRAENPDAYVIRSSWVYSEHGQNFVKTMLKLAAERDFLSVVNDQLGSPTYARNLALYLWRVLEIRPEQKLLHFTDGGITTWFDFAVAIFTEAFKLGLIKKIPDIRPIAAADYPSPAQRPAFSGLDCSASCAALGVQQTPWQEALCDMLARLSQG